MNRLVRQCVAGVLALAAVSAARAVLGRRPGGAQVLARFGCRQAERAGLMAAVLAAARARRRIPAYRAATAGLRPWRAAVATGSLEGYLAALPILDKASYIDAHPLADRCPGGRLPERGVEVDESSGSSGRPYQWVRSRSELDQVEARLAVQAGWLLRARRHRRIVVLNCFSMGAWATGQSVTRSLSRLGAVKSCGPDTDKALAAIELLGSDICYVVSGYPPFLGTLLDAACRRGLDLSGHEMWGFVGGEGMTEVLRARLERTFRRVLSAYGASDLDVGVAGETELAVAVRQAAAADPRFADALFGGTGRLPMVLQYDPTSYHVETIGGELVVTVLRKLLSPRIRYAVHDAGGTFTFRALASLAREHGVELPFAGAARAPFLFISGRIDSTLSHMGANLYPEDVDAALGTLSDLRPDLGLGTFCLALADRPDGTTVPVIHVESVSSPAPELIRSALAGWLVEHNHDWSAAAAEDSHALDFEIRTAAPGTGVFAANATRIKRRYVLGASR
jgi:phenylacetate-CoA ligase